MTPVRARMIRTQISDRAYLLRAMASRIESGEHLDAHSCAAMAEHVAMITYGMAELDTERQPAEPRTDETAHLMAELERGPSDQTPVECPRWRTP